MALRSYPRRAFAGLQQNHAAQPLWSIEHYNPLGQPVISPDGHWIVLTRPGNWLLHGETLIVVDLVKRVATDYPVPPPGLVGSVVFDRAGKALLGIVDTPAGHAFARWEFPSMTLSTTPLGAGSGISSALNHLQDKAVVMREDGVIEVYELPSGRKLLERTDQQGKPSPYTAALAISPDDTTVASGIGPESNQFIRWRLADGERVESPVAREHLSWGNSATYTRGGAALLVTEHHKLDLLDANSAEVLSTYPGNGLRTVHEQPDLNLAAAPIGQGETFGVIDTMSGQLRMWGRSATHPPSQHGYVDWACISPDSRTLYTADYFSVKAWDLGTELGRRPEWLFAGRSARMIFPSTDRRHLIAVGETIDTWSLLTRKLLQSHASPLLRQRRGGDRDESWQTGRNTLGTFALGDHVYAVVDDDVGPQVIEILSGRAGERLGAPRSILNGPAAAALPSAAPVWRPSSAIGPKWPEVFPEGRSFRLECSPDGRLLLACTRGGPSRSVTLWNLATGRRVAVLADEAMAPTIARFSSDGQQIVIGTDRGEVALVSLVAGLPLTAELVTGPTTDSTKPDLGITEVLMPARDHLYLGTRDGTMALWTKTSSTWYKQARYSLGAPITRLAISPNQTRLAVILFDPTERGSVLVINTATGQIESRLDDNADDACFLSEAQLATNTIRIWTLDGK